ncbi:hypothetical protein MKW98_002023 [Papaver atlanticum]|uniref:Uncharacterized protein n=1 Tax=Papaver atlanticum TaxID=357466 RepID=A0AAD4SQB6_9MAGN|nr:hypothetical protein MKW98_002023 [Papaver atlanticum]
MGVAIQLINDVLDFTGTSASLGKGSLSDIRHGIVTAPILFAMEEFPQLRKLWIEASIILLMLIWPLKFLARVTEYRGPLSWHPSMQI